MLKLRQGQLWKTGEGYVRIVDLQRLEVKYKAIADLGTGEGTHQTHFLDFTPVHHKLSATEHNPGPARHAALKRPPSTDVLSSPPNQNARDLCPDRDARAVSTNRKETP